MEAPMVFETKDFRAGERELMLALEGIMLLRPVTISDVYNELRDLGWRRLGPLRIFQTRIEAMGFRSSRELVKCWRCKAGRGQAECPECEGSGKVPGGATLMSWDAPRHCAGCGLGLAHDQTSAGCPRCLAGKAVR